MDWDISCNLITEMNCLILFLCFAIHQCSGQTSFDDGNETSFSGVTSYDDDPYNFDWFIATYNKTYDSSDEEDQAKANYYDNKQFIDDHNELYNAGQSTFELGINEFTDMDIETLVLRNGRKPGNSTSTNTTTVTTSRRKRATLPTFFSWLSQSKVTSVKNQEQCGSCYAFASAAAIESQILIKTSTAYNLSTQQIIDCSQSFGNAGCGGGLAEDVYRYVMNKGGLDQWQSYPYKAKVGACNANPTGFIGALSGFKHYTGNVTETWLKQLLMNHGPISVGMDASVRSFQFYKSGVYTASTCQKGYFQLDHAVLVVGFGQTKTGRKYWLIRNSWGKSWGINGNFKIAIANNMCGIQTDISFPILQ